MRVKSHWFRPGRPKSPEEVAGAIAFISWKVAQNALKRMRKAGFDIDPGPAYFAFLAEALAYCVQVAWRHAHGHFDEAGALAFMTALGNRCGETLEGNYADLLGVPAPGAVKAAFVVRVNEALAEYAEFGYGPAGPDFAFLRYFASRIAAIMDEKDRRWTHDQVMAIEAPEAAATLAKAFADLHDTGPGRRRRATGTSGE